MKYLKLSLLIILVVAFAELAIQRPSAARAKSTAPTPLYNNGATQFFQASPEIWLPTQPAKTQEVPWRPYL